MKKDFTSIDSATLDSVTGGANPATRQVGQWATRAAKWGWENVAKPAAIGAGLDKAAEWAGNQWSNWRSGGQQPQNQAPQQGQ